MVSKPKDQDLLSRYNPLLFLALVASGHHLLKFYSLVCAPSLPSIPEGTVIRCGLGEAELVSVMSSEAKGKVPSVSSVPLCLLEAARR